MAPHPSTGNFPTRSPELANTQQAWLIAAVATASLAFAIALGAFGAHGLKAVLPVDRLTAFETASRYHFYSSFFLYFVAGVRLLAQPEVLNAVLLWGQRAWGYGTILFCGSIYLVSVRGVVGMESASWLGAVAPVGGLLLIAGAAAVAYQCWVLAKAPKA